MGAAKKLEFACDPWLQLADAMALARRVRVEVPSWSQRGAERSYEGIPVSFEPRERPDTVVLAQRSGGGARVLRPLPMRSIAAVVELD